MTPIIANDRRLDRHGRRTLLYAPLSSAILRERILSCFGCGSLWLVLVCRGPSFRSGGENATHRYCPGATEYRQ
jgi:hypothetical protein